MRAKPCSSLWGVAQFLTQAPAPLSSSPALLIPTPWSSPRQGAASPDSLEKQKEDPTPSFALPLSSRSCLPRKGAGAWHTWHRPHTPPLWGMRFAPPPNTPVQGCPQPGEPGWIPELVKPWTASLSGAAASVLPPNLLLSFILVIQALELQQLSHCSGPSTSKAIMGVRTNAPAVGTAPELGLG